MPCRGDTKGLQQQLAGYSFRRCTANRCDTPGSDRKSALFSPLSSPPLCKFGKRKIQVPIARQQGQRRDHFRLCSASAETERGLALKSKFRCCHAFSSHLCFQYTRQFSTFSRVFAHGPLTPWHRSAFFFLFFFSRFMLRVSQ